MFTRVILICLYGILWFSVSTPGEVFVRVEEGLSAAQLAAQLCERGVLLRKALFLKLTAVLKIDRALKYGAYKFYRHEPAFNVISALKKGRGISQLIQVCRNLSFIPTKERELKSLIKASDELNCSNLLVISYDYEGEEEIGRKKIKFIPLWKWLLQ